MITSWNNIPNASGEQGPDLITNGSFSGDDSGWSVGSGWSYGGNEEDYSVGATGRATAITGNSDGNGYTVGDIVTLAMDGNGDCQIKILGVGGSGSPTDFELFQVGTGYTPSDTPLNTTGGTGSGATFTVPFVSTETLSQQIGTENGKLFDFSFTISSLGVNVESFVFVGHGITEIEALQNNDLQGGLVGPVSGQFTAQHDNERIFFWGNGEVAPDAAPWTGSITNITANLTSTNSWANILQPSPLSWSDITKAAGTAFTNIPNPSIPFLGGGMPIGLLMALTYAGNSGFLWTNVSGNSSNWTNIPKAV